MFAGLGRDSSGVLDFQQLVTGLSVMLRGTRSDWAEFEFKVSTHYSLTVHDPITLHYPVTHY